MGEGQKPKVAGYHNLGLCHRIPLGFKERVGAFHVNSFTCMTCG